MRFYDEVVENVHVVSTKSENIWWTISIRVYVHVKMLKYFQRDEFGYLIYEIYIKHKAVKSMQRQSDYAIILKGLKWLFW